MERTPEGSVVTVFGGNGFIGRSLVRQLVKGGYTVRVASRAPQKAASLQGVGGGSAARTGSVLPIYASVTDAQSVRAALQGAQAAINLVSILTEKNGATFRQMNAEAPGMVAQQAAEAGVERFVQVSAIGASRHAPSLYGRSKAEGERLVREAFVKAAILRPSVVFGPGDSFLTLFGLMARVLPVLPVYFPRTHLQPVFVENVARAAMLCLTQDEYAGRVFELGGPDSLAMEDIMRFVAEAVGRTPRLFAVPEALAGLQARVLEKLPGKVLTRDQLAMLSQDNVVTTGAETLETLGIVPDSLYDVAPPYLSKIRALRTIRK